MPKKLIIMASLKFIKITNSAQIIIIANVILIFIKIAIFNQTHRTLRIKITIICIKIAIRKVLFIKFKELMPNLALFRIMLKVFEYKIMLKVLINN